MLSKITMLLRFHLFHSLCRAALPPVSPKKEMFRNPTDKNFSELGGAAALISPQTAFDSAVLLLAAFKGAERREDMRYT